MIRKEEEVSKEREISKLSEYGAQLPDTFPNVFHVC